jgi:dTDP-4-dehydrorhamnose reductase
VGASGLLGTDVAHALTAAGISWIGTGREVDVTSIDSIWTFAGKYRPDWIINCAAYTAVDRAESEPEACHALNAIAPGILAEWCREHSAVMIHISTDYVFSGDASEPYQEESIIGPLNVYGKSKAGGEVAVRERCARHYIVRTGWLYGEGKANFVSTVLRLLENGIAGFVVDQSGTPTWSADLAKVLLSMRASEAWGTYHVSGEGYCTRYEFAEAIRDEAVERGWLDSSRTLRRLTTSEFHTIAARPLYSVLSKAKLRESFGLSLPPWRESLHRFFDLWNYQPVSS